MEHHEIALPSEELKIPASGGWANLQWIGLGVGVLLLGISFAMGLRGEHKVEFYYSYLFAVLYFLTIALGGLFFTLLQFLTRAGWSVAIRRLSECVMGTVPLFALLFVPILIWHGEIFHWVHPVEGDKILEHKVGYLNSGFFTARAVLFFAIWWVMSWYFLNRSRRQDETGDIEITRRLQKWSALGMVLFALSLNFAAFDWVMSLDPHWFSTIFGVYMFAGCFIAILATIILLGFQLQGSGLLKGVITWEHYHDLGKLLFGFTVFWAYIGFSQFMLIWYGNIPEETVWFYHRWHDSSWQAVSIFLAVGHFGVPFLFLLSKDVKRRRWSLSLAAIWMLAMHAVDIYWLVMPNLPLVVEGAHGFRPTLVDFTCWLGVGGLFLAVLGWRLKGGSLLPVKDPRLAESLAFENA